MYWRELGASLIVCVSAYGVMALRVCYYRWKVAKQMVFGRKVDFVADWDMIRKDIDAYRKKYQLTQIEFALAVGIAPSALSFVMHGGTVGVKVFARLFYILYPEQSFWIKEVKVDDEE